MSQKHLLKKPTRHWMKPALKIAVIYFLISFLWIVVSDRALDWMTSDHELLSRLQTFKGWFFISISTLLIYVLVWNEIRKKEIVEKHLSESEQKFRLLFENMNSAFAFNKIILNKMGQPIDYLFLEVNPFFEQLTGLKRENLINKTVKETNPLYDKYLIEVYGEVALTGQPRKFIRYSDSLNKHFEISAYSLGKEYFAITFNDVSKQVMSTHDIEAYQQKLKNLINDLFAAEEREKRRLAVNLHDHFSQLLAIAKMKMSEYLRKQELLPALEPLLESKKFIEEALQKTRAMTYELCPPILYELGLISAMDWLLNSVKDMYHFEIRFFKKTDTILFGQEVQIMIYRVLSEMLNNIIKHAQAKTVLIYIEQVEDLFYLRVIDDGIGFDPEKDTLLKQSFGLFSIRERIESLRGNFQIITAPGKGTIIDIAIPTK